MSDYLGHACLPVGHQHAVELGHRDSDGVMANLLPRTATCGCEAHVGHLAEVMQTSKTREGSQADLWTTQTSMPSAVVGAEATERSLLVRAERARSPAE